MADKLTDLIAEIVKEKTFSLEAVQAIEQIRAKAATLELNLQGAREETRRAESEIAALSAERAAHRTAETTLEARQKAVAEREKKMTDLERETAVSKAEARVLDNCLSRLLGNRQIRETITSSVPIQENYSGGGSHVSHHTKTDNVTREEA